MTELETIRSIPSPSSTPVISIEFSPHGEKYSYVVGETTIEWHNTFYGSMNEPITFTATVTMPSGRTASSFHWEFGDGNEGSGNPVSHTYSQATVNLNVACVVTDNFGVEWTARKTMYIKGAPAIQIPVTDTLMHLTQPATFQKLPWSESVGSWATSGWDGESFVTYPKAGSRSGIQYLNKNVGPACVSLRINSSGTLSTERQVSVWLNSPNTGEQPNGYQLTAMEESGGAHTFKFILRKWVEGIETSIETISTKQLENTGSFGLTIKSGVLQAWLRSTAAVEWGKIGTEHIDKTFTEGYAGIDCNGTSLHYINFSTGFYNG